VFGHSLAIVGHFVGISTDLFMVGLGASKGGLRKGFYLETRQGRN
jgi:hypothetical protein